MLLAGRTSEEVGTLMLSNCCSAASKSFEPPGLRLQTRRVDHDAHHLDINIPGILLQSFCDLSNKALQQGAVNGGFVL
jgi:hypothetical protein